MENNKLKSVDPSYFGATEDEWNNLLIDFWNLTNNKDHSRITLPQYQYLDAATGEILISDKPVSVSITLKK